MQFRDVCPRRGSPPGPAADGPAKGPLLCGPGLSRSLGLAMLLALVLNLATAATAMAAGPLTIGACYSPPLAAPNKNGYFDLLLAEAFARLGLTAFCEQLPAERSLLDAEAGRLDGDVGRVRGIDGLYPNLLLVDEPVLESRDFVAFALADPPRPPRIPRTVDWQSLAPYHVGYVRGWKIFEQGAASAASATPVRDTRQLFTLLAKGRVDLALSARLDGLATAKELGLRVAVAEPPLASRRMYLYLHRRHEALAAPLAEALRLLKTQGVAAELMERAMRRYTDVVTP